MNKHYSPADYGSYYVEPYTLIGHEACDVMAWVEAHPDYRGAIEFERWDFEGSIDVTDTFIDPDREAMVTKPAETVSGSVNLLDAVRKVA